MQRSFFAKESGCEEVDSFPRLSERFVCSLEGLVTLPQDVARLRSRRFMEPPLALIRKPLALIRKPLALIRYPLPLVGGTISFVCATRSLVEFTPQLLKARRVRRYCFRFSTTLNHDSVCG